MDIQFSLIDRERIDEIVMLGCQLNPSIAEEMIRSRAHEMFEYSNYHCFGMTDNEKLIGIMGGWLTTRLYSGKQLEIDHVVVSQSKQSQGLGAKFLKYVEEWAKENGCLTIELNAYVANDRSHKFYFAHGYSILGFHFQKKIATESGPDRIVEITDRSC